MILPTIAPMAVLSSLDEPVMGVGPAMVELEVTEDWVDEPVGSDPVEVTDSEEVADSNEVADSKEVADSEEGWDDESEDNVDDVGDEVEEMVAVIVEGRVGVTFIELGDVTDTGGELVVLGGGVGPP
jgi:hypothetical protein